MSKNNNAQKTSFSQKAGSLISEFKNHWNTPAEGKYVPYKEYVSIFLAVGGNYSAQHLLGMLSFGTGCYLVAYYYEIPILTFSAINAFFLVSGYLWSILNMGIDANLGILPKKTEKNILHFIYLWRHWDL